MKPIFKFTTHRCELTGIAFIETRDKEGRLIDRRVYKNGMDRVIDTHTPSVGYSTQRELDRRARLARLA